MHEIIFSELVSQLFLAGVYLMSISNTVYMLTIVGIMNVQSAPPRLPAGLLLFQQLIR